MSRRPLALVAAALGVALLLPAPSAPAAPGQGADDPVFTQGLQWGLERIGAPAAWSRATGEGTTIAVIDSGADLHHEDLVDQVVASVDCIGAAGDPARCDSGPGAGQDDSGHGTHVAGIATAATGNGRGIAGVAPDARLMVVRVLEAACEGCEASGTAADVAAGIRWAVRHGADVINLSLGGGALQSVAGCGFCEAIEEAWAQGVIAVVAAGNDIALPSGFGDEPAVVVAATTRDDGHSSYSNSGSGLLRDARWPVSAPGGEGETSEADCATGGTPRGILSTYWIEGSTRSEYACLAGTSMAAPHVAGALAVLLSQGRGPQAAIDRLLSTATDLGPPGRDLQFGEGRVDLALAVSDQPGRSTTTAPSTSGTPAAPASGVSAVPPATVAPGTNPPPTTAPPPTVGGDLAAAPAAPDDDPTDAPGWLQGLGVLALVVAFACTAGTARLHLR